MSSSTTKIQIPSPTTQPTSPTEQTSAPIIQTTTTRSGQLIIGRSNGYFQTVPGFLKLACVIFTLIGYFCASLSDFSSANGVFSFRIISMLSFWFTIVLIVADITGLSADGKIPWTRIQFYYSVGAGILFLILSTIITSQSVGLLTIAGFCGFIAMCAYGYDAYLKYRDLNTVTTVVTRTTTIRVA